jgi:glucose uptake protein
MFIIHSSALAIVFCIVTMLGWGSWANTQKLAGKEKWPFALYYWDYGVGVFLMGLVFALTLGVTGGTGVGALASLGQASSGAILAAIVSGALFNVSNILLVAAIDAAGMSVAFPVGVGLALVIGTLASYIQTPKGNPLFLFGGVALVVVAMLMSALAHSKLPRTKAGSWLKALLLAALAGSLMGFFYPQLMGSISPDFQSGAIQAGYLTPYSALLMFGVGLLLSNFLVNAVAMRTGGLQMSSYFRGTARLHSLGMLGGAIWMLALGFNVIASGVAGPAVSYALGQGATLIAAIWGVAVWKEFRGASRSVTVILVMMFLAYSIGLAFIGSASLVSTLR